MSGSTWFKMSAMKTDEQLMSELRAASEGMMMMSESDYPFEVVRIEGVGEVEPDALREMAGSERDAPVETQSMEEFFGASLNEAQWKSAKEIDDARKFQALTAWLKENLSGTRVYRVGRVNMAVYILGRAQLSGNLIGLSTRIVET